MSELREQLVDRMIRIYGFEHPIVIDFCKMCEGWENNAWNDRVFEILVQAHEEYPQI